MTGAKKQLHAIVVGKTKLAESDLIVKLLLEDGSKYEAVAKSARKPQGALSSKIELFNEVELIVSPTRGLSIISECKLVGSCVCDATNPNVFAFCSAISEYAQKISESNLPIKRLFDLIKCGLNSFKSNSCISNKLVLAAIILKGASIQGTRPILSECVYCSKYLTISNEGSVWFSFAEGGTLCDECATSPQVEQYSQLFNSEVFCTANYLINSPFIEITNMQISDKLADKILDFSCQWLKTTFDINLKSIRLLN